MNMKFAAAAVLGLLSLGALAPNAAAADNGFYLGAGITQTKFNFDFADLGEDDFDDNGFKVIAGFRPFDWLAFEANYIDLGGQDDGDTSIDSTELSASALVLAEIGIVDLYARVGMANWDTKLAVDGLGSAKDDGWEPTYGVGVGVHFGSIGVRGEWERFSAKPFEDVSDDAFGGNIDTDVDTFSISLTYTFL